MADIRRFEDLETRFDDIDEWVTFKNLVGREILVHDFIIAEGEYGKYAIVKFTDSEDGKMKATTTGATVILKKLNLAKEKNVLPLIGKIVKEKRYYDIK